MNFKPPNFTNGKGFNKAYKSLFHWFWTDKRIPKQLEILVASHPTKALELGCGVGYFSEYLEDNGIEATGIDFSSVAIERAKKRTSGNEHKPTYLVGDVTNLPFSDNMFDVCLDVGCFHCLNEIDEQKYLAEVYRVLKPNGILLIWALRVAPSGICMNSEYIATVLCDKFSLEKTEFSRRKLIASNWFWLKKI